MLFGETVRLETLARYKFVLLQATLRKIRCACVNMTEQCDLPMIVGDPTLQSLAVSVSWKSFWRPRRIAGSAPMSSKTAAAISSPRLIAVEEDHRCRRLRFASRGADCPPSAGPSTSRGSSAPARIRAA